MYVKTGIMKKLCFTKPVLVIFTVPFQYRTILDCKINYNMVYHTVLITSAVSCTNKKAHNVTIICLRTGAHVLVQLRRKLFYFHVDFVSVCDFSFYFHCD